MTDEEIRCVHPFEPVFDNNSRLLVLGSFPSVRSRQEGFFYGHPRNRFWRVMAAVLECPVPESIYDKKRLLLDNRIALWDAAAACVIKGSADSSIKGIIPNDIDMILKIGSIDRIYANGKTAGNIYEKHIKGKNGPPVTVLPSTSPANAAFSLERLIEEWRIITAGLKK